MKVDYSISWGYIVSRMESLYGTTPDSEEKFAMGDIERRINYIWQEYFEMLYKHENTCIQEIKDGRRKRT